MGDVRLLFIVLVSLLAIPCIFLSGNQRPHLRELWTILAALIKLGLVISLIPNVLLGNTLHYHLFYITPKLPLALTADAAGLFFALVAAILWLITSFYSIGYMRALKESKQTMYYASFALCLSATMGIAFAANLMTFLIFFEILTIATYPLVVHKQSPLAWAAGRKYLFYTLSAGLFLMLATVFSFSLASEVDFQPGGFLTTDMASESSLRWLFLFFMLGVGVKAGLMPLHSWLPSAMIAPTPVSALLHAVAVVKAGVFGVIRVTGFVFGPELMTELELNLALGWAAGITIILASLIALQQDNLKRRLAYSTVGHLSYIILGAALMAPASLLGSVLHLLNHATMKITLFFCAGAILVSSGKTKVSELNGIAKQMPLTMSAFALASMGLVGLPPVNGFVSKWHLAQGTIQAEEYTFLGILLCSGLLNAAYFFPIIYQAFFKSSDQFTKGKEAPYFMLIPILITAGLSFTLGIFPDLGLHLYTLAEQVMQGVLGGVN